MVRCDPKLLIRPDGGECIHWPQQGHDFRLKISPERDGSFSLTEVIIPPGNGAGLHIHEQSEECWYVLDGEYRFTVGGSEFTAGCEIAFQEIGVAQQTNSTGPDFWSALGERTHTRFNVG